MSTEFAGKSAPGEGAGPGTRMTVRELNGLARAGFVEVCGPLFEGSPWIAERAWERRPFASREELLGALVRTVEDADEAAQIGLIRAHPDLVGRLAREGRLGRESSAEQRAAGLDAASPEEAELFDRYNRAYRARFGFPFVICARENRKEAILAAFPVRLAHGSREEIATALAEIGKIARLRLLDRISEE